MNSVLRKIPLALGVGLLAFSVLMFAGMSTALAQSSGSAFQITSSKDISAIQGESFTYFVVTENNTDYQLQSELPAGLSFANGSISGTPQEPGEYEIDFVANTEGAPVETVNLTVLSSSNEEESVSLDEVPETGFSADQTITLTFYLLALLLLSVWGVKRFFAARETTPSGNASHERVIQSSHEKKTGNDESVGGGIVS